jgi:hypothetical protein
MKNKQVAPALVTMIPKYPRTKTKPAENVPLKVIN